MANAIVGDVSCVLDGTLRYVMLRCDDDSFFFDLEFLTSLASTRYSAGFSSLATVC